jgi:1,4-alpha-glucan branching enzyme
VVTDRTEINGQMRFSVYLPHAERVELMGDFTDWEAGAIPMNRGAGEDCGWWTADCPVPEGEHSFAYLVDSQYWMPDYAATGVHRNAFGRWTSDLCVEAGGRARTRQSLALAH